MSGCGGAVDAALTQRAHDVRLEWGGTGALAAAVDVAAELDASTTVPELLDGAFRLPVGS